MVWHEYEQAITAAEVDSVRAKNSYSIEHRLIDYAPTAF
jgi:hypothetical protein